MTGLNAVQNHNSVGLVCEESKTWPQFMAVWISLLAVFNSGLHFGWPSPSIPKLLSDEYALNVTSEEASYITIIGPIGDIFGSVIYPALMDVIGRKQTILLIALPQTISMLMIYMSSYGITLLYVARFIGGLSEAACFTVLPVYIGEVAEPKIRGRLGSFTSMFLTMGILVSNIVGSVLSIESAALLYSVSPILFVLLFLNMPETPYYLIMKEKTFQAENSLKFLRRKNNNKQELDVLTSDVKRQMSESRKYIDLYRIKTNRYACFVMFMLRIFQQSSGASSFTLYMQVLFEKSTNLVSKQTGSQITFVLNLLATFLASFVVDKVGRKPLLIISSLGCCFMLTLQGSYYVLVDYVHLDLAEYSYIPLLCMIGLLILFSFGLGNVVNLLNGEMFSSSIKAKASSLLNIFFGILLATCTKFFQYTSDTYGMAVPFLTFAFCQVLGTLFCYFVVPETKGKSLEDIQQMLKRNAKESDKTKEKNVIS